MDRDVRRQIHTCLALTGIKYTLVNAKFNIYGNFYTMFYVGFLFRSGILINLDTGVLQ